VKDLFVVLSMSPREVPEQAALCVDAWVHACDDFKQGTSYDDMKGWMDSVKKDGKVWTVHVSGTAADLEVAVWLGTDKRVLTCVHGDANLGLYGQAKPDPAVIQATNVTRYQDKQLVPRNVESKGIDGTNMHHWDCILGFLDGIYKENRAAADVWERMSGSVGCSETATRGSNSRAITHGYQGDTPGLSGSGSRSLGSGGKQLPTNRFGWLGPLAPRRTAIGVILSGGSFTRSAAALSALTPSVLTRILTRSAAPSNTATRNAVARSALGMTHNPATRRILSLLTAPLVFSVVASSAATLGALSGSGSYVTSSGSPSAAHAT